MALLFWSTSYSPGRAQAEIQQLLLSIGARRISQEYSSTGVAGMSFELETVSGRQEYLLPVRTDAVREVLRRHGVLRGAGQRGSTEIQRAHAESVAWRTLLEWLKVQAAIVETEQAAAAEVMLPYMLVGGNGAGPRTTVYEQFTLLPQLPEPVG